MGDGIDAAIDAAEAALGGGSTKPYFDTFTDANGDTWSIVNGQKGTYLGRTRAPGTSSSTNFSSSSSTSQSFQDPVYLEILRQQGRDAAEQFWAKLNAEGEQAAANRRFTTGERVAGQQFTAGENAVGRQFTAGENALNRALTAGQFAATMQARQRELQFQADQDYQSRLRQFAQDKLNAAQTFASMVGATDPAALEAFYAAGGGNISNALQSGASAVSDNAVLPAAQALRTSREMLAPSRYTGFDSPFQMPEPPTMAAGGRPVKPPVIFPLLPGGTSVGPGPNGESPLTRPGTPSWVLKDPYGTSPVGTPVAPQPEFEDVGGGSVGMGRNGESPLDRPGTPDFARYAFGTMGKPAKGTFITGDSTHPTDPFAGGAKPEKVTVKDPPGANNAEAEVEPMAPPEGMGSGMQLANLLHSIASMLDGGGMMGEEPMRMNMGGMMHMMSDMPKEGMEEPRYAYGTGYESITPTPADDPYMQEVRNIRQNVQFPQLNPYDVKFGFTPQSLRSRYFAGMQTRYGVPEADQMEQQQRYALRGTSRGSYALGT